MFQIIRERKEAGLMDKQRAEEWAECVITAGFDIHTGEKVKITHAIDMLEHIIRIMKEEQKGGSD